MRARVLFSGGFATLLLFLCLTARVGAQEIHIQKGGSGADTYDSLEALRLAAAANPALIDNGDVIILHNDDDSLTDWFELSRGMQLTIRSASGGQYAIRPGQDWDMLSWQNADAVDAHLVLQNVSFDGGGTSAGALAVTSGASGVVLDITGATFENHAGTLHGPIYAEGATRATITNSVFSNNSGANVMSIVAPPGGDVDIDIVMNSAAAQSTVWKGNGAFASIDVTADFGSQVNMNFDVANLKKLRIDDPVWFFGDADVAINKNGGGVLRLEGKNGGEMAVTTINEGTMQFGNSLAWVGDSIHVGENGVFKITADPGNLEEYYTSGRPEGSYRTDTMSYFVLNQFTSEEGARTEIGNISMYPKTPVVQAADGNIWTYGNWVIVVPQGTTEQSTFASTMNIDNRLLKVTWKSGSTGDGDIATTVDQPSEDKNVWFPHIERVENLRILDGVGDYADVYRKLTTLTDVERDALDTVYAQGGAGQYLGHLQTIGGAVVQYSSLAMRHNFANLLRNVNRRATRFQREELEVGISGSDWCRNESDPETGYGEIWAYIDQNWIDQDDLGTIAGYRYNPYGIGIGYDKHCDEWIYGGVLRYDTGDVKLKSLKSTKTEVESLLASVYASWASEGIYLTGAGHLGYGWNESHSSYTLPGLVATGKGDYGTSLFGASVETGYMMETGSPDRPLRVTPFAGLAYARINREGFTEKGAGNLNRRFNKTDWDLWDFTAGIRVAMPMECDGYTLIPSLEAALVRTMGSPESSGDDVRLVSNPLGSWTVDTFDSNRSALRLSAAVNARFRDNLDVGMAYEFEWRKKAASHQLNVNVSKGF